MNPTATDKTQKLQHPTSGTVKTGVRQQQDTPADNQNKDLKALGDNARDLTADLAWLSEVLQVRLQLFAGEECAYKHITEVTLPPIEGDSIYAGFLRYYGFNFAERLTLLLALSPHIYPTLLQQFFKRLEAYEEAPEGLHHHYLPNGETLLFLLADNNLEDRFALRLLLGTDHAFSRHHILSLEAAEEGMPRLSGLLKISAEYIDYFTTGVRSLPDFGPEFPARRISTALDWEDLVLPEYTLKQLEDIRLWMEHGDTLLDGWGLRKKLRPGHRALFYGEPGTGKSMTACLLGKTYGKPVYKIDLSLIVSKYIGETTKNLAKVFDQAEKRDWIIFFDEADALFGKRTEVADARDRHANQEVAYLLQRIEHYEGIIVLASNFKDNLDKAFARRFESMIHFPLPDVTQRLRLWEKGFSPASILDEKVVLKKIARDYELSGGAIINVIRHSSLMALKKHTKVISLQDILEGIRKEVKKEGKTI